AADARVPGGMTVPASTRAIAGCLAALAVASCASEHPRTTATTAPAPTTAPATTTSAPPPCDPRATLRPTGALPQPGHMPVGTPMRAIQDRGFVRVGVDQNTLGFAFRDPSSGRIEGLEVDLAHEIARAIFGNPDKVDLKPVVTANKIEAVLGRKVDLTIDAIT